MPKVSIKLFATLREKYGKKELTVECDGSLKGAVLEACKVLGKEFYFEVFTEEGNLREDRIINVNGRNVKDLRRKGEQITLGEGDRVSIFPPLAGGRGSGGYEISDERASARDNYEMLFRLLILS